MKRTKLKDRILPSYTRGEEIFNMVSHIVGGALGILSIVLCAVFAGMQGDPYKVVSGVIFGVTMLILYTMSSIYHGLSPKTMAKRVFQIIDHCSIFILIAGTYTPVALCAIREVNTFEGWLLFGIVWAAAIIGIVFNSIDIKKYKILSMILYLVMGWCVIFRINVLIEAVGWGGFWMVLLGGVAYTIGAVLYGVGKKHKWMHSIFHIFCIIASILHLLFVLLFIIL